MARVARLRALSPVLFRFFPVKTGSVDSVSGVLDRESGVADTESGVADTESGVVDRESGVAGADSGASPDSVSGFGGKLRR